MRRFLFGMVVCAIGIRILQLTCTYARVLVVCAGVVIRHLHRAQSNINTEY
jgi:hypothetical protein